jgi:hypothetical protein
MLLVLSVPFLSRFPPPPPPPPVAERCHCLHFYYKNNIAGHRSALPSPPRSENCEETSSYAFPSPPPRHATTPLHHSGAGVIVELHDVLPSLAMGKWPGRCDLYCDGHPHGLP